MFKLSTFGILSVLLFTLWMIPAEATIQRIDLCGVQYTKDQLVPLIKNERTMVVLRGDLVDLTTGILAPPGFEISFGRRNGGGGTNTAVEVYITPGASAAVGDHNIKLNYQVEVGQPDIFKVRVKLIKIDSLNVVPHYNVQHGTLVTFTATGTGLANLKPDSRHYSDFKNLQIVTSTNTTLSFKGNAENSATIFHFFDSSMAGQLNGCNGVRHSGVNGNIAYSVGKTDLTISKAAGVYRFLPQPEICVGVARLETQLKYCTGSAFPLATPTSSNPHVERVQNIGGIMYVVKNTRPLAIGSSIKVQLKNGSTVLKEDIINGMPPDGVKVFTYSRPENRRMLMRDLACTDSCYDLDVAPYNWRDPVYTTVVDVDNSVDEGTNEGNNTVTSD